MKPTFLLVLLTLVIFDMNGQARLRRLATNINHPAINVFAPYISLDGNTLVYVSDYGEDNDLILNYTVKTDAVNWKDPVSMQKTVNNRLTYVRGFALSENGKTLWLTSLKGGGLGGYDIHVSELSGQGWSEPRNLGMPINSKMHDGAPSLTADGRTMYFMRCESMDRNKAGNCRLLVARKNYRGQWEEPADLPEHINTGNSQVPRIMGDGVTLIFSSDRMPGNKGGMDLYQTRWEGEGWSRPVPLDFVNSEGDDQFVSASSLGRHLLKDQPGARKNEIVEVLFPKELKPLSTMKVEGAVKVDAAQASVFVSVFDHVAGKRVYDGQPSADGTFTLYLSEGGRYDLSVEPQQEQLKYFSKSYDLTGDHFQISDRIQVTIGPLRAGDALDLPAISFEPYSAAISPESGQELRRLARLIRGNPDRKFLLDLTYFGYREDSLQTDPDLTEHIIDSTYVQVLRQVPDSLVAGSLEYDSLNLDTLGLDTLDRDTLITIIVDSLVIRHRYHNDRTARQAQAVVEALVREGASPGQLETVFRAVPGLPPDNRRTKVSVTVQ